MSVYLDEGDWSDVRRALVALALGEPGDAEAFLDGLNREQLVGVGAAADRLSMMAFALAGPGEES